MQTQVKLPDIVLMSLCDHGKDIGSITIQECVNESQYMLNVMQLLGSINAQVARDTYGRDYKEQCAKIVEYLAYQETTGIVPDNDYGYASDTDSTC